MALLDQTVIPGQIFQMSKKKTGNSGVEITINKHKPDTLQPVNSTQLNSTTFCFRDVC
jgi:hypothetical protein